MTTALTRDCGLLNLEQGRMVEQGSHSELLAQNGPYATLFRMQAALRDESSMVSR